MLRRPDEEFDDPTPDEWAGYILDHMNENVSRTECGYTNKMLMSDLNIEYDLVRGAVSILLVRRLVHEGRSKGNEMYFAPRWYTIPKPDLTELQAEVLAAMESLADGDGIVIASCREINEAMAHPRKNHASVMGMVQSLDWKNRVRILQRGNGIQSKYQILEAPND